MRTEEDVIEYSRFFRRKYVLNCKKCNGLDIKCRCNYNYNLSISAYEACIPQDFWFIDSKDIDHNLHIFKNVIKKYVDKINVALKNGYGLIMLGDNGVGKTFFISYILMSAIKKGKTAFYTTMPQLDYDTKLGFKDQVCQKRLRWLMTSDFVAIDELGKEKFQNNKLLYMDVQIERILKNRFDDSKPVILATNMDYDNLLKIYGSSIGSILSGKYKKVFFETGDYRLNLNKKMSKIMEY